MLSHPLCVFCSTRHTQKELLNWQMDHIQSISQKYQPLVLRHFYRYVESEVNSIKGMIDELRKKENSG
jgi:hypothetical protein